MRCAVVQTSDNIVVNLIMADPSVDPAPEGTTLVGLPDNSLVSMGWIYAPDTGQFTDPNPPVEEAIEVTP
jgi:hypothetical protein